MSSSLNLRQNVLLAPFTTYQIGGAADFFLEARSREDILEGLKWARTQELPFFVLGGGSNVLFDDKGFRGLVIWMKADHLEIRGTQIWAEAGVKVARLVQAAYEAQLAGLEEWTGLPGTLGGAVFGNAGCFGLETKDILVSAELIDRTGNLSTKDPYELAYSYRNSLIKKEGGFTVLSALIQLKSGGASEIQKKMREILVLRAGKQPPGLSTGSFFKNHSAEQSAGWLLDQCGLKGYRIGNAKISEVHANFFMNAGGASSKDVLELAEHAKETVLKHFGIELHAELVFVPETGYND